VPIETYRLHSRALARKKRIEIMGRATRKMYGRAKVS
jgi:hypothetical protein